MDKRTCDIEAQRNQNVSDVVAHLALDPPQITGFVMCEVQKESDTFCSHRLAELHKLMRNKNPQFVSVKSDQFLRKWKNLMVCEFRRYFGEFSLLFSLFRDYS